MNLTTTRVIGNVLETSWGRESSADGTYSIKYALAGNKLTLKFTTVVHFASESSLKPQIEAAHNQAIQLIDNKVGEVKKAFKKVSDTSLKLEDVGGNDDIELISVNPFTPRKVAYYRYNHVFLIED